MTRHRTTYVRRDAPVVAQLIVIAALTALSILIATALLLLATGAIK